MYAKPYSSSFGSGGAYCTGEVKPFFPWAPWDDVKNGSYVPIKVMCVCYALFGVSWCALIWAGGAVVPSFFWHLSMTNTICLSMYECLCCVHQCGMPNADTPLLSYTHGHKHAARFALCSGSLLDRPCSLLLYVTGKGVLRHQQASFHTHCEITAQTHHFWPRAGVGGCM